MKKYDVIIIGSGIGGLICGCYLVKSGLKVLILEKNNYVGGYCHSFEERDFVFNSYIRGFVGCGKDGAFNKILNDFDLIERANLLRPEVYDTIKFKGYTFHLFNDVRKTINKIRESFPKEDRNIVKFFELILNKESINNLYKFYNSSFEDLVNLYFSNPDLKFLMTALRIDSGKHCHETSAIADTMLIRGNMLDGGYFPKGGMSNLAKLFADYFEYKGGEILLNKCVTKVEANFNLADGVIVSDFEKFESKWVVSNADLTLTYNKFLTDFSINSILLNDIKKMKPSTSLFVIYLALAKSIKPFLEFKCAAIWDFLKSIGDGIVITFPSIIDPQMAPTNAESITMYYGAPYKDEEYWEKNRDRITEMFLNRFCRVFPEAKSTILLYKVKTPIDLHAETFNRSGSSRGWEVNLNQFNNPFPECASPIPNLFFAGHWTKSAAGNGGVTFAAISGKKAANLILNKK
jgi:phytoene dehydrogenase-like protein